jgi:tetratricopeptide (TPR) repeat protein
MRLPFYPLLCVFAAVSLASAPADTIRLKNGRSIWAETITDKGTRLEYSIGDNTFAIPKSLVDHVEAGGAVPATSGGNASDSPGITIPTPGSELQIASDIYSKVLRDHRVDPEGLAALEKSGDPEAAAAGYFVAGRHELERGNFSPARSYYEKALHLRPENPTLLMHYAAALLRMGHGREGLASAEKAARLAPDSADAWAVLGAAQYASDRNDAAQTSWKHSLSLHADANVERMLAKAQRDSAAEASYSQGESSHFTLHYEGQQTSESFRRALLSTLESQYDELSGVFNTPPRDSIAVILYTGQAFFDVTQAPAWSGAINDGKLRIPVNGLDSVTPDLARVLKHELAHSFITYLSRGRCPQWLHEGIAQLLEPRALGSRGNRLSQLFQGQNQLPFNMLEGGFINFSTTEATLAYDESLAAAEYISETYGVSDLTRILQRIGEGSSTEAALRATIHADYGSLETELARFLSNKYGR